MDDSGEHTTGYTHDVYKVRLDPMGIKIESEKAKSKYFYLSFFFFLGQHCIICILTNIFFFSLCTDRIGR